MAGNNIQSPHQADARGQQGGQLPAESSQLLGLQPLMPFGFRQILRIDEEEALFGQFFLKRLLRGCFQSSSVYFTGHIFGAISKLCHLSLSSLSYA
ncbi:MAG: hypothetical protein V8Q27_03960 [Eubacteriales bacterium]